MIDEIESEMSNEDKMGLVHNIFLRFDAGNDFRTPLLRYCNAMEYETKDTLRRILKIPEDNTELFGIDQNRVLPFNKRFLFLLEICYPHKPSTRKFLDDRMNTVLRIRNQIISSADSMTLSACVAHLKMNANEDILKFKRPKAAEPVIVNAPPEEPDEQEEKEDTSHLPEGELELRDALFDICDYLTHHIVDMISIMSKRYLVEMADKRLTMFIEKHKDLVNIVASAMHIEIMSSLRGMKQVTEQYIRSIPNYYERRVRFLLVQYISKSEMSVEEINEMMGSQNLNKKAASEKKA